MLIDPTMQKAFLLGINGCIEHLALEETIGVARKQNRTGPLTFFDLEDAFCSVPHSTKNLSNKHDFLPENINTYFSNL